VFVCSTLSQAPASRKRWTIGAAGEDIVVEIPESGSLDARTIKHVIGLAVRVEIGRPDQSIAAGNGRPECANDERGAGQGPDHRLARACTVKELIGFVIAIKVCRTDHSPVSWKSWTKVTADKNIVI
jgi:hypothetical protein